MRNGLSYAVTAIRLHYKKTQWQTAELCLLPHSKISEYETGNRPVTMRVIERYAHGFNIAASSIVFIGELFSDDPPSSINRDLPWQIFDSYGRRNHESTQQS